MGNEFDSLRLFCDRSDEVVTLGDLDGFLNLSRRPLGGTPIIGKIEIANHLSEALNDLLHGCSVIWSMSKNDIDVRLL